MFGVTQVCKNWPSPFPKYSPVRNQPSHYYISVYLREIIAFLLFSIWFAFECKLSEHGCSSCLSVFRLAWGKKSVDVVVSEDTLGWMAMWPLGTLDVLIYLDTINVINVKLCMMVVLIHLYVFISLQWLTLIQAWTNWKLWQSHFAISHNHSWSLFITPECTKSVYYIYKTNCVKPITCL